MLFVTHNLPLVRSIAQRVAVMSAGRIVELGAVDPVLLEPTDDYTQRLLSDTPSLEAVSRDSRRDGRPGDGRPGVRACRDAFERNLVERADGGCALAAVVDGLTVVDLWGGSADAAGRPWQRDTAAVIFSGSKGVVATLAAAGRPRRLLEPTAPVAELWPEFGAAGKDRITVAQLFAHAGGVPGLLEPIDRSQLAHPDQIAARIAAEPPLTEPGGPATTH